MDVLVYRRTACRGHTLEDVIPILPRENQPIGDLLTPMLIGNARVSNQDQTLNLQQDTLEKAGCTKIFTDTASGSKAERKGLEEVLNYVRKGDTLVVWRLDRLGRSLPHLISTMTALEERGIGFKSLTENIDTTTSGGNLFSISLVR
jgi:DNA invertase Pin-like site-specific DNA recombinase